MEAFLAKCWFSVGGVRMCKVRKNDKVKILKKAKILLLHDLGPLDMFRNHFSFDFTLCVSLQCLPVEIFVVLWKCTKAGKIIECSKLISFESQHIATFVKNLGYLNWFSTVKHSKCLNSQKTQQNSWEVQLGGVL